MLFADDANADAGQEEKQFHGGRSVAAGGAVILEQEHAGAGGYDPDGEQKYEIDAVESLQPARQSPGGVARNILCGPGRAETRDLQPGGRLPRAERSRDVELAGFLAAQFPAGGFGNTSRRYE